MKIYFTASSSGSHKKDRENYLKILQEVKLLKHTITNPYYAALVKSPKNYDLYAGVGEGNNIFGVLRKKIAASDCIIAEISIPSTSLGIQIEYALNKKIPVLCLFKKGENGNLPLMVRDYKDPLLFKKAYTKERLPDILKEFLSKIPKTRIKFNMFITYELDKYLSYLSAKNRTPKSEVIRHLIQEKMKSNKKYSS